MNHMIGGYKAMYSCDSEVQPLIPMLCTSSSTYIAVDGCHHPG